MDMINITLEGKEYQLDIEQAEKLGLLKGKDDKVKSWDEFMKKNIVIRTGTIITKMKIIS